MQASPSLVWIGSAHGVCGLLSAPSSLRARCAVVAAVPKQDGRCLLAPVVGPDPYDRAPRKKVSLMRPVAFSAQAEQVADKTSQASQDAGAPLLGRLRLACLLFGELP